MAPDVEALTVRIVDRHVAARFLWNFAILFALLFVFAVSVDVIIQLDRFIEAADEAVAAGRYGGRVAGVAAAVFSFHGPRVFQFYAYLMGLVAVGAMGFTLAQMHRHRELTALLASGWSLQRVGLPILASMGLLAALQLANTELVLPRLAPLLLREHGEILEPTVSSWPVPLTPDARGRLVMAERFDPRTDTLLRLVVLDRDEAGAAVRRIAADRAVWSEAERRWRLEGGFATARVAAPGEATAASPIERVAVDSFETDLDPRALRIRRSVLFAQMLSLRELAEVAESGGVDPAIVAQARWGRFAGIASNLVVLLLALPSFLLREPAGLLGRSLECAAISIGAMLVVLVGVTVQLPGLSPALTVFLPTLLLAPIAAGRYWGMRT